ncbi:MAG TPA: L-histidine N(alpha)-methyltransferase [Actinomycetota bacterium]|nr:L-histidine N(alpha)-methyltransferase [Actinomycetota bacterium]
MQRCLSPEDMLEDFRQEAREGLTAPAKSIPSKWFYDKRGSELFEEISRLPEYYLTRSERRILTSRADIIAMKSGADTLIELGSGTSEKTRLLLDAFLRSGALRRFVPFDVDEATLRQSAAMLMERYPNIEVDGIVGDFEKHLDAIESSGRSLVIFLGSTIGNLDKQRRRVFLKDLVGTLKPGDTFLLGADLVKDISVLEAAYNDAAGVTARFNLNVLSVMNRELGANFDLDAFEHLALFDRQDEAVHMWLRSAVNQVVEVSALNMRVGFSAGELLHTEISSKFRRAGLETELTEAGLEPAGWWTDSSGNFALSLSVKV